MILRELFKKRRVIILTIKQLKRRVVQGLVEPELFYMPLGKKTSKEHCNALTINIYLYNTLNLETMEYSNSDGLFKTVVLSHIIILDSNNNVFFNSKKHFSTHRENTEPSSKFILNDVPYGDYQVKIIYATSGGVVDDTCYNIKIDDMNVNFDIYLKYYWTTVSTIIDKNNNCNHYIGGYSSFKVTDVEFNDRWDRWEIFDDEKSKMICTAACKNGLQEVFATEHGSQDSGYSGGRLYINGKGVHSYKCNYFYQGSFVGQPKVLFQGEVCTELLDNPYIYLDADTLIYTNCLSTMYERINSNYSNSLSFLNADVQRARHITCREKSQIFNYQGEFISETEEYDNGYVYSNTNFYGVIPTGKLSDAIFYYKNNLHSADIINEDFFNSNNYLIVKTENPVYGTIYSSVTSWGDYCKIINGESQFPTTIIEKCSRYDIDKYYFDSDIIPYDIIPDGLYNRQNKYFKIIYPSDKSIAIKNQPNYFTGYKIFGEDTKYKDVTHVVNNKLKSYSYDYDQY